MLKIYSADKCVMVQRCNGDRNMSLKIQHVIDLELFM